MRTVLTALLGVALVAAPAGCTTGLDTDAPLDPVDTGPGPRDTDQHDSDLTDTGVLDTSEGPDDTALDAPTDAAPCPDGGLRCDEVCLGPTQCCTDDDCPAGCDEATHTCRCIVTSFVGCHEGDIYYFDSCERPALLAASCEPGTICDDDCVVGDCPPVACVPAT